MIPPRTCVDPAGRFIVGIHNPSFSVKNLRDSEYPDTLGRDEEGRDVYNRVNFPMADLDEPGADPIYEVANAFDFKGTSYINSAWADAKAEKPETIRIAGPGPCSFMENLKSSAGIAEGVTDPERLIALLPHPLKVALAQASTDPEELTLLARLSCTILFDPHDGTAPAGIGYKNKNSRRVPDITDHELFEVLVNNPCLPDSYKNVLVLKPGVQGENEITGEYRSEDGKTHVFEYLRRNSYIPWGHFASNMANDAVRYSALELSQADMTGIRHLYYQRAYVRMAEQLGINPPKDRACLDTARLETLRQAIAEKSSGPAADRPEFDTALWGWNFGFGYAQSGHRLHASHQMIHQQNAMIPGTVPTTSGGQMDAFACGDQVARFIGQFKESTGQDFFPAYIDAVRNNTRTDGRPDRPDSLVVAEDDNILLFAPKAQICEFELQLIPKTACGNVFEADTGMRRSLDRAILTAVQVLESLGAKLVTSIEYSKRFGADNGQHLVYSFIPRLPYAPPTFSEAQNRWICGLYPEDFASACKAAVPDEMIFFGNT